MGGPAGQLTLLEFQTGIHAVAGSVTSPNSQTQAITQGVNLYVRVHTCKHSVM